jgi:PncC family amidohydrolase
VVPKGATILEPVGTAPGLVVPPASGEGPTVLVLPGPPRELQPMWRTAVETEAFQHAVRDRTVYREGVLRLFGIPESEIAATLRVAEADGVPLDQLEVTTCLRRGEIEIATRYEPPAQAAYQRFVAVVRERHGNTLYSDDGATVDAQVAALLKGPPVRTVATAESCTAGLLTARLTERPGSSAYVVGGVVVYSNEAKITQAGVDAALIERHGAVSPEVAEALAVGAAGRFGADLGIGVTGIAGPDGGTPDKPVGTVAFAVADAERPLLTRTTQLPGGRADVRDRSGTVAMHLLRRVLQGNTDGVPGQRALTGSR